MSKDDFFIGWAPTPKPDRRFFMMAAGALVAGTTATAAATAHYQRPPGRGHWNMGAVHEWTGIAVAEPYAMLRTIDLDGTPRTVMLGCQGKCGVAARIGALAGRPVIVKGSLIHRGANAMIAVVDGMDWIREAPSNRIDALAFPEVETLEEVTLRGEILDSKCWFGAMRPSEGKVHKSCAALCIRGGIPPAFFVKTPEKQSALMIMTDKGLGHGPDLLPYVADPVEITATLQRQGELFLLDGPVSSIRRV